MVAVVLLGSVATAGVRTAQASSPKRWVMGYYVGSQRSLMPPSQIDWGSMTHIVVGPVTPRSNGTLNTTFDITAKSGPATAKDLARRAKAHHVVPLLMIGGAGVHNAFLAAARHHRATLETNLIAALKNYDYAGLDLDWEPVNTADRPYVTALINELRAKLPHAVLTMPVLWVTKNFPTVPRFYGTLAKKLDRVDVMSYGMAGPWDGWRTWHSSALTGARSNTPSAVDVNVASFERAGVPKSKLGVGIGFYGSCWTGGVTGPRQKIGSSTIAADDNAVSYRIIKKSYYSASAYHYDGAARAPYLSYKTPHGARHCTYISYENGRSITAKGKWAKSRGVGALIVWTINQAHVRGAAAGHRDVLLETARKAFGA